MERHVEILEERDSLKRPLVGSLVLHGVIFGVLAVMAVTKVGTKVAWGDPNSLGGGGSFAVTPVKNTIQMPPRTGIVNKVASDTESQLPEPVTKETKTKRAVKEEPDAIALKSKKKTKFDSDDRFASRRKDDRRFESNQMFSRGGQAAVSPLFQMAPGSGGVGVGSGAPFGQRCGGYAMLVRDRVAGKWRTEEVDSRLRTLPAAVLNFDVYRDGRISNIRVAQTSGNRALDYSAQRAVTEASPLPAIPAGCDGNPATVEFWFELKR